MTETGYLTISAVKHRHSKNGINRQIYEKVNRYLYRRTSWLPISSVYIAENCTFYKSGRENEHTIILHAGKKIASFEQQDMKTLFCQ